MVKTRPATQADFSALGEPIRRTCWATAVEHDGELVAAFGYYLLEGSVVIFSSIAPTARERVTGYPRHVLRFARALMREASEFGLQILAGADPAIRNSDKLLERLGFEHEYKEVYSWHGQHSRSQ